jgi:hypothetical protein
MIERVDAIFSLVPDADVVDHGDHVIWKNYEVPPISEDQINTELQRLQELELSNAYKNKRVAEYPSIGDQLDALFHAGIFPEEMAAQIQAVKDKYPKA